MCNDDIRNYNSKISDLGYLTIDRRLAKNTEWSNIFKERSKIVREYTTFNSIKYNTLIKYTNQINQTHWFQYSLISWFIGPRHR